MDIMIHNKRSLSTSLLFGSLLILGATTLMGSSSTVIHVSAQNTTNSLTESEPLGIITITVQQLKELENSMSDIRQALEQSNTIQALLNLTILEGQISVLAEET
jgi:vacuolar-type H+-ATPase subunit F/Vma7